MSRDWIIFYCWRSSIASRFFFFFSLFFALFACHPLWGRFWKHIKKDATVKNHCCFFFFLMLYMCAHVKLCACYSYIRSFSSSFNCSAFSSSHTARRTAVVIQPHTLSKRMIRDRTMQWWLSWNWRHNLCMKKNNL